MRRRGAARLRLRAWPPSGALVGPPGLWARGARRPCRGPSLRSGPSVVCSALGPLLGGAAGRCAALRPPLVGLRPARLRRSPLRSLGVAPVASGCRRPACARRPAPGRPPPPPAAAVGPPGGRGLRGWAPPPPGARCWRLGSALGCCVLPVVALRAAAASPLRARAGAGPPPPPAPFGGSALRAARAPPARRGLRPCGPPFRPAPPGLGVPHRGRPGKAQAGPPWGRALPGRPLCGCGVGKPP